MRESSCFKDMCISLTFTEVGSGLSKVLFCRERLVDEINERFQYLRLVNLYISSVSISR